MANIDCALDCRLEIGRLGIVKTFSRAIFLSLITAWFHMILNSAYQTVFGYTSRLGLHIAVSRAKLTADFEWSRYKLSVASFAYSLVRRFLVEPLMPSHESMRIIEIRLTQFFKDFWVRQLRMHSGASHHYEVLRSVVQFILINVMDNLTLFKASTYSLFGYQPMLSNITLLIGQMMTTHMDVLIAVLSDNKGLPMVFMNGEELAPSTNSYPIRSVDRIITLFAVSLF